MKPPITPETTALLALLVPPTGATTTAHTDALYAMAAPLHEVLQHVQDKFRAVDRAIRLANGTENQEYAYAFFERLRQTVLAGEAQVKDALAAVDALADTCFQFDRYALEMDHSLDTYEERTKPRAPTVTLSAAEHAHLVARATAGDELAADVARGQRALGGAVGGSA